jgi:glycerate kinase
MKKVVFAIDSFKGSLTSLEAGQAAAEGLHRVFPEAEAVVVPVADGGEGTVEALTEGLGGRLVTATVDNPLGRPVEAAYGLIEDRKTAVIEMSAAAGITLLTAEERNPMNTTTYGVGQLILDAIRRGCRHFLIGIGGSATNDGGIGMLEALGFGFYDESGNPVSRGGKGLDPLHRISVENAEPTLAECTFRVICDVTNPLCGEKGCSAVYGPQKGATPEIVRHMDGRLKAYAALTKSILPHADENAPGAGAAGGLGFAFLSYLNATLHKGIDLVLSEIGIEDEIRNADMVITGEGRLDGQTVMGKTPVGVARIAKKHGKPVIALAGSVAPEAIACNGAGIDAFFPILRRIVTLEDAMKTENAHRNMADTAEQAFRLLALR